MNDIVRRVARSQTLVVPWMGPSTNSIYAGMHWTKRRTLAEDGHLAACAGVRLYKTQKVTYPIDLEFFPLILAPAKLFDTSNYSFTGKMVEDGLVKEGILVDDSIEWVRRFIIHPPERAPKGSKWSTMKVKLTEVL